MSLLWDIPGT